MDISNLLKELKEEPLIGLIAIEHVLSLNPSELYIVGCDFVEDDFMSEFERSQLEYDGKIAYPAKRINYDEFMEVA